MNLISLPHEYEWLDFKENWFSKDEIGEYISAISNGAALSGREYGYIVWGVSDKSHEITGTTVNFDKDIEHEPYKHYLARNLKPSLANKWLAMNAPMISVFTDRIEIVSHGGLGIEQDLEGFYNGVSIPVNEALASIFLQLRLSERSGRGVPTIVNAYGRDSITVKKNFIVVTIPFNKIDAAPFELNAGEEGNIQGNEKGTEKVTEKVTVKVTENQKIILKEIEKNAFVSAQYLSEILGISLRKTKENLSKLKSYNLIRRIGPDKGGHWEVVEK
jgi:predicted HTH transcriptional regulator